MTRRTLIVGASGGIGAALAAAAEARGDEITRLSRRDNGLDVTDAVSVASCLGALDGPFDQVWIATGVLAPRGQTPEKSLSAIDAGTMANVLSINAIGTALLLQSIPRLLANDRPSQVAVLTARVGSIGDNHMGGWYSYRASKAAANQIVRTAAIEIGRKHKHSTIVALHPGTVDTAFTANYPAHKKVSADQAAQNLLHVVDNLTPAQTGHFFDWAGKKVPW